MTEIPDTPFKCPFCRIAPRLNKLHCLLIGTGIGFVLTFLVALFAFLIH